MKYLCPGCDRLVEVGPFRLDAGALVLRCARCGEECRAEPPEGQARAAAAPPAARPSTSGLNVVPLRPGASEAVRLAAEAAASEDPFRVPEGRCPKCVAPRKGTAISCPGCGLVYELFDPSSARPGPPLAQSWIELLAHWGDEELHEQMLRGAVARGELAAVGRLYRTRLAFAPEDPLALFGRDEVLRRATAHGEATVPSALQPERTPTWKLVLGLAFALLSLGMVLLIARKMLDLSL